MRHVAGGRLGSGGLDLGVETRVQIHRDSPVSPYLSLEYFAMITSGPSPSPTLGSICIPGHTLYSANNGSGNHLVPKHSGGVHYRGDDDMMESTLRAQDEHDQEVRSNECGHCSYERMTFVTPLGKPVEAIQMQ